MYRIMSLENYGYHTQFCGCCKQHAHSMSYRKNLCLRCSCLLAMVYDAAAFAGATTLAFGHVQYFALS